MPYIVQIGEDPCTDEYASRGAAEDRCWELAREMAKAEGYDVALLGWWVDRDANKCGVCPPGDDGAYWPYLMVTQ